MIYPAILLANELQQKMKRKRCMLVEILPPIGVHMDGVEERLYLIEELPSSFLEG